MSLVFISLIGVLFSTPLAALAVAGGVAAIPVIIHLLNRKRYVVVPWAAMRFLLAAQKRNVRRLRLEQWVLLATRMLIGVLIVVAMAAIMPWAETLWLEIVPGGVNRVVQHGRTHRIIVIDGSFTMATRLEGEGDRFERAKEQAKAVLDKAAPGDGFSVIFLTSTAQTIIPGPADDRRRVAEEIDELKLPHGSADVAGGLRMAINLASRPLGKYDRREVVFVTDLKRSGWPLAPPTAAVASAEGTTSSTGSLAELGKFADVVFIDVARADVDNVSVSNLTLGDSLPLVDVNTTVAAVIHNFGKRDVENLPVALRVGHAPKPGEKLILRDLGQKLVNIKAGNSITATFLLENQNRFREAGDYLLQAQAGTDDLRLDNVRSLAVTVRDSIPVLVVDGKISAQPLDTPGEWVRRALRPVRADGSPIESPASPTLISATQFGDRFRADLTKYDCVFLCDVPSIGVNEAERLEAHLRRGGSIVVSLGPNAARNSEEFNRVLYADGKGLLPGKITGTKQASGQDYFSLFADEEAFKQPPLNAYRDDRERAALSLPQFQEYVQLQTPPNGAGRRIFSFVPSDGGKTATAGVKGGLALDPAIIDFPRHRGRVIVYTSTFNPERIGRDQFWSNWPPHPTFLPFLHETLRYVVANNGRRDLLAGEILEEYLPAASAGLKAKLIRGDGPAEVEVETADVVSRDDAAAASFSNTALSGVYRVSTAARSDGLYAVNVPVLAPGGGQESDLRRWSSHDLQAVAPEAGIQVVGDASEIQVRAHSTRTKQTTEAAERPEPQGANVAQLLLSIAFVLMLVEVCLAWRLGSARASTLNSTQSTPSRRPIAVTMAWLLPTLGGLCLLGTWAHATITDDFLGFLPSEWRQSLERSFNIPQALPGEGTRWRLQSLPFITGSWGADRWIVAALALLSIAYVCFVYGREKIGYSLPAGRRWFHDPRLGPALLRSQLLLITLFILLPQLHLLFEREAWPDVVIIFDDSKSMASVEPFSDPVLREKSDELKRAWAELAKPRIDKIAKQIEDLNAKRHSQPSAAANAKIGEELATLEKRLNDLRTPHRLNLVKALLASRSQDWLQTLVRDRKMRVHLFRGSTEAAQIAELSDPAQCSRMLEEIIDIVPEGESSRLGDVLGSVLKTFRGKSLNAVVMFTDGQTTHGEEPSHAALLAKRKKTPLFFVGVGDASPRPDIIVGDLRAEREVIVKDRLVFDVRITSVGAGMPATVPVNLYEMVDGKPVRRDSLIATPSEKPIRLTYVPDTPGDKLFVVEVPVQEGETDQRNNRLEHEVHVAQMKRLRVLMIESVPRYEFRYIKSLFEREAANIAGNKSVELNVLLTGANKDYYKEDKSAIAEFPGWETLRTYDVIILGDLDPRQLPREQAQMKLIADFVKERGGGLLLIAGEHFSPRAYAGTDLADVLPITTEGIPQPAAPRADDPPLTKTYRPRLTSVGQNHPVFRFVGDEADNLAIWNKLQPMYWFAKGYRRKLSAEVLAVHPEQPAEGEPGANRDELHPLVLQHFVGAGRVMFFGFDETWRWRFRLDEMRFNQFWVQTIRSLARTRVGRIELSVPARMFRVDDPIRVTVRFPDDAPAPAPAEIVQIKVERRPLTPAGQKPAADEPEIQTIQLTKKEHSRATYETLLTRTAEGEYQYILTSPVVAGRPPKAEATVLPPKGEMEDTRMKDADLRKAAAESPGAYVAIDRASEIPDLIPDGPRIALDQPSPPLPLWNLPGVFALVFLMILMEWLLRKRGRLL